MLSNIFPSKSPQLVGIDISSANVKLLTLSRNGKGYRVDAYAKTALPDGAVVEKEIKDVDAVSLSIKKALSLSRSPCKLAAIALADSSVITKIIQMDAGLSEIEMEEQVLLEADKHIPYPLDEVRLDFQVLGQSKEDERWVDVLLAASRAETVDTYVQALTHAGLTAQIVEVESYVMQKACRLLAEQLPNQGVDQTLAVIDIGANRTSTAILHDFLPIFTRGELFGGQRLTKAIASRYGLSLEEAEECKTTNDLPESYPQEVLHPFKEDVVQHIRRALQFYSSASQAFEINHIILAGGTALLPELNHMVADELKIETTIANPVRGMHVASRIDADALRAVSAELMICCGLALRSFD